MTQQTLAELLCVCRRSVQSYEAGATIPYRHLHRLAEIFERPASWFLYGDDSVDGDGADVDRDREILERLDAQSRALKTLTSELRTLRRAVYAVANHLTDRARASGR